MIRPLVGRCSTRWPSVAITTAVAVLGLPALVLGHAVVYPAASAPGAYERYLIRVPNEKNVPTTRVEIRFPADLRVVSFGDVAGWKLEPVMDSASRITGAVWTGTLAPERFVEFPFIGVNPRAETRLVWPVYQTYADGERVEWTGPADSDRPASATVIRPASESDSLRGMKWGFAAAVVLSLISLGVALRPRQASR